MKVNVIYSGIEFTVVLHGGGEDNLSSEIFDSNGNDIGELLNDPTVDAIINMAINAAEQEYDESFTEPDED